MQPSRSAQPMPAATPRLTGEGRSLPQLLLVRLLPTQLFLMHLTGPQDPPTTIGKGERRSPSQVGLVPPNAPGSLCRSLPSWFGTEQSCWKDRKIALTEGKTDRQDLTRDCIVFPPSYLHLFLQTNSLDILAKFSTGL